MINDGDDVDNNNKNNDDDDGHNYLLPLARKHSALHAPRLPVLKLSM